MRHLALLVCLTVTGCGAQLEDSAVPDDADIAAVEQRLASHSCVRDLSNWERTYRYSRKSGLFSPYSLNPDFDVIEFHLRRAGDYVISPGRNVIAANATDWPDGKLVQTIDGTYTIGSRALRLSACAEAG